jgi:hypothetical protein
MKKNGLLSEQKTQGSGSRSQFSLHYFFSVSMLECRSRAEVELQRIMS